MRKRPAALPATCYRCREPLHDPNANADTVTGFRPRTICPHCLPGELRRTVVFLMRHRFIGGRDPDCVLDMDPRLRAARERFRAQIVDHWRHPEITPEQRAFRCRNSVEARLRRNEHQRCVRRISPAQFKKCRERRDAEYRCALKLPTAGKLPNQLGVTIGHDRGSFQTKDRRRKRRLADTISAAALDSTPDPER